MAPCVLSSALMKVFCRGRSSPMPAPSLTCIRFTAQKGFSVRKMPFESFIDLAARRGGTYYLTYHRYATRKQVETCYPQFAEFLRLKKKYDPEERFQSDWYRHYKTMFADSL